MGDARLAILWHLHQPDYRDPETGTPVMPWVRMHALRGYRDLALETVEQQVAVTVNVVPSLLDQLLHYARGGADAHLDLTRLPADALDEAQRGTIAATFFGGHARMRRRWSPYARLEDRVRAGDALSVGDWRDLQVWSTLAWFGATALRDHPELGELRARGHGFTEVDKARMLAIQERILVDLPRQLAAVASVREACISTSPYFHPILPLLVDTAHARRALPHLPTSPRYAWPEDALLQLTRARARVTEILGVTPTGLWPSEGSVSPEILPLVAEAGFTWLATDDGILARSDRTPASRPGPWAVGHGLVAFFRDHDLSDRIGFDYAGREPEDAVADLVGTASGRARDGILTIALDGENPWEVWADAGAAFRERLYATLREGPCRGISLDDAARSEPVGRVTRLHTGSWIDANLAIWFGDPQDRIAWGWLADARRRIAQASPERASVALDKLLPAQGSDWMWWFGPEFDTPFAATFDALFRAHLRAVYAALGQPVPEALDHPIALAETPVVQPRGWVAPRLDAPPSWSEWAGAGEIPVGLGGTMAAGVARIRRVRFGWSRDGALWLRADGDATGDGGVWQVEVDGRTIVVDGSTAASTDDGAVAAVVYGDSLVARADTGRVVAIRALAPDGGVRAELPPTPLPDPPGPFAFWWV